jgi:hypothetical protein
VLITGRIASKLRSVFTVCATEAFGAPPLWMLPTQRVGRCATRHSIYRAASVA